MLMVEDLLVSDELVTEYFACNLSACKGACCWEGDFGAPLEAAELPILEQLVPIVAPYLSKASLEQINQNGPYTYFDEMEDYGTSLMPDGSCVFLTYEANGIATCGIEKAWKDGHTEFQKPISCHLYPVRVLKTLDGNDYALNYDRWDICCNACSGSQSNKIKLYQFVKSALIRKYGEEFFNQLTYLDQVYHEQKD